MASAVNHPYPTPEVVVVTNESFVSVERVLRYDNSEFNKSYFVRFDEGRNRSHFTYYSEFNRSFPGIVYAEIFFLCLLTLISTVGNVLISYVVFSNKRMRTITNIFIANMCIADILFTLPNPVIAVVRYQETWSLGDWSCGLLLYNQIACAVVSIWSMTLISIDRHRCIVRRHYKFLTDVTARIAIAACWILALGLTIPIILYFNVETFPYGTETVRVCTLIWPRKGVVRISEIFVSITCIFCFLIPLTFFLYNYITIFKTLWKTRRTMARHLSGVQCPKNGKRKQQLALTARNNRDFRVVKMLVFTVVVFGLMWLPMAIVFLLIMRDGKTEEMRTSSSFFLSAACIAFANACVNPVIYGLFNEKYRIGIRKAFNKLKLLGREDSKKVSIQSISALAEMNRASTPSSSSDPWRGSCSSISGTGTQKTMDTETKLQD